MHTGRRVRLAVRPAPSGTGIVFVRTDITDRDNRIPVSGEAVVDARLNTMIENGAGVRLSTIEHLMAAFAALGVSNAVIEVDLTTRELVARLDGEEILRTTASIGLPSNPTPPGTYYIFEEIPQTYTGGPFGPMIMATSAYSERLDLFENGLPIVALHGTNTPNLLGQQETNGCIRIANELITDLADKMPPGVPLIITESAVVEEAQPQAA